MRRRWIALGIALVFPLIFLGGCGQASRPTDGVGTPTGKEGLDDLVMLLKHFEDKKQPPPRRVTEIEPVEPLHQAAYLSLLRGDVIYAWGVPIRPASGEF